MIAKYCDFVSNNHYVSKTQMSYSTYRTNDLSIIAIFSQTGFCGHNTFVFKPFT